jgi:hypothetical protein
MTVSARFGLLYSSDAGFTYCANWKHPIHEIKQDSKLDFRAYCEFTDIYAAMLFHICLEK